MKLKENQKIYIRGGKDAIQGKRVIAELERRGGVNKSNCSGIIREFLYYIRHDKTISQTVEADGEVAAFLKEYYTEVKVNDVKNKWPKKGHSFFIVDRDLTWHMMENKGDALSKAVIKSGNCFHSLTEADQMAKEFREIIKFHNQLKKQRKQLKEQRNGKESV